MILKIALGAIAVVVLAIGGYAAIKEYGLRTFAAAFDARLEAGDYLAALAAASKMKEGGAAGHELDTRISSAARLLVAEDALVKAKKAAEEKRFADAGALLRGSDALSEPSFRYYEEAQKLYRQVEAFAAGAAHQTAVTISALENQASTEKSKRAAAEKDNVALAGTLKEREAALRSSQKETEAKQMALAAEQTRTENLKAEVEKESKQKFFTELKTYRDLAQKGREQLDNAVVEIESNRDVTAVVSAAQIYIGQGKILFEQVRDKASGFRSNRTPAMYHTRVDDLINSIGQFLEASKQFRNTLSYIDDKGSTEFTTGFTKGKTTLGSATSYLSNVTSLIASNP